MRTGLRNMAAIGVIAAVAIFVVACGSDDDNGGSATATPQARELVVNLTAGTDDPHRASLALTMADAALKEGHKVAVFLNVDGVELAVRDLSEDVQYWEFPPVREMLADVIEGGATVLVCPICVNEAGIPSNQLLDGVVLATPVELFPYFDRGAVVISY
jgi:predicted peroxiredoxin